MNIGTAGDEGGTSMYICPVCGDDRLKDPPEDHMICPVCHTHFAYDDCNTSHEELRRRFVRRLTRVADEAVMLMRSHDARTDEVPLRVALDGLERYHD